MNTQPPAWAMEIERIITATWFVGCIQNGMLPKDGEIAAIIASKAPSTCPACGKDTHGQPVHTCLKTAGLEAELAEMLRVFANSHRRIHTAMDVAAAKELVAKFDARKTEGGK